MEYPSSWKFVAGVLLLVAGLALAPGRLCAQEAGARVWGQGGPAMTTLGPGLSGTVGVVFDRHILALRGTSTDLSPGGETWDVAIVYGRMLEVGAFRLSAGTGMAVTGGRRYTRLFGGGASERFEPMIGFPIDAHAVWVPLPVVAVGLHAFADVNTEHPFGGVGFIVRAGRLR